jgi:hypothetical protein
MMAESLNEQNRTAEALTHLNDVRRRAGLNDTTAADQATMRDIILHERQIELAFEDKRWNDLVRTGRAVQVMNAFGQRVIANPQDYYYPVGGPFSGSFNVTDEKLVMPLPVREIIVNPQLVQNSGY